MSNLWIAIIIIAVVALVIYGWLDERKRARKDRAILRHTVEVNLGILKKELIALNAIATQTVTQALSQGPVDNDSVEAAKLLASAATTVKQVESKNFDTISRGQFTVLLTAVFEAMDQATRSRHLLKACQPFDDLRG